MRKAIIFCALWAGAAYAAGSGSVVASFRSPCTVVYGLDYEDGYLYHAAGSQAYRIYKTTTTGSVVKTIYSRVPAFGVEYIATHAGSYFWVCNVEKKGYRLTTSGSVVSSFTGPGEGVGITFDESDVWYSHGPRVEGIYRLTTRGSVISSFYARGVVPEGIEWDGSHLWVADSNSRAIWRLTVMGSVVEYIPRPGRHVKGVTWDGKYIWYSDNLDKWVYCMTVGTSGYGPASLGKVKAVYR